MDLKIKKFEELSNEELYEIFRIRIAVFVVEQDCTYHELDDLDQAAYHFFYQDNGKISAYLRLLYKDLPTGQIKLGRVITSKPVRGTGLGLKIMQDAIKFVRENIEEATYIRIEAQTYAKGFYEKVGFNQSSDVFDIDGIPHIEMILYL